MIYYNIIQGKKIFFESDIIFASYEANLANAEEQKEYLLDKAKQSKLAELEAFHNSNAVKYLTIKIGNLQTGIFVNQEYRYLIDEQRELLQIRINNGEQNPTWLYQNGVTLPLDLKTLNILRLYIGKLTDDNFRANILNKKTINAFKVIEEVENFDVKTNYRINQILTF
jgi:hypothetical protein